MLPWKLMFTDSFKVPPRELRSFAGSIKILKDRCWTIWYNFTRVLQFQEFTPGSLNKDSY